MNKIFLFLLTIITISVSFISCERNDMYYISEWYKTPPRIFAADYATNTCYIYVSDDNGATWKQTSPQGQWGAVASSDDGMKLVASELAGGIVYISSDGGKTWEQKLTAAPQSWAGLAVSSDGKKIVAADSTYSGGTGYIYYSTDKGNSWAFDSSSPQAWGAAVMSSDGQKVIINIPGFIINTLGFFNGALSTNSPASLPARQYTGLAASSDGMKLYIGVINAADFIYKSNDGGANWVTLSGSPSDLWQAIASSSDGMKLAALSGYYGTPTNGYIYTSSNGGATWIQRSGTGLGTGFKNWRSLAISTDGMRIAAGEGGATGNYIYISANGGETWVQTSAGTGSSVWNSIVFSK